MAGTQQALNELRPAIVLAPSSDLLLLFYDLLGMIASRPVRNRPGRVEPRAVKRRTKCLKLLTILRSAARRLRPE